MASYLALLEPAQAVDGNDLLDFCKTVLTFDEARRIAVNVVKLPEPLGAMAKTEKASP